MSVAQWGREVDFHKGLEAISKMPSNSKPPRVMRDYPPPQTEIIFLSKINRACVHSCNPIKSCPPVSIPTAWLEVVELDGENSRNLKHYLACTFSPSLARQIILSRPRESKADYMCWPPWVWPHVPWTWSMTVMSWPVAQNYEPDLSVELITMASQEEHLHRDKQSPPEFRIQQPHNAELAEVWQSQTRDSQSSPLSKQSLRCLGIWWMCVGSGNAYISGFWT